MKAIGAMLGVILLFAGWAAPARAELPPAAVEILKQFEDETAGFEKKIEADVQKWREKTAVELKKVQDAFCKEAKLDEAVAVRDLIRRLQSGGTIELTPNLPPAVQEVYQQYDKEIADVYKKAEADLQDRRDKTAAELKKVQDLFCKEAKLDEAVAVRDLIRDVRDGISGALPDPGYINNGSNDIGKVFFYQTTGVTTGGSIYGTDIFTTGSHLAMAAVHSGVLKAGQRGVVRVTILPGQASYAAATRHGITSYGYGAYSVSFKVERVWGFVGRPRASALADPGTLVARRGELGKTLLFDVTGTDNGSVWGTGVYTDDSSLAKAAVHAGVLAVGQNGIVKVTILPGQQGYAASTQNGITSGSWGSWVGSYRVEAYR